MVTPFFDFTAVKAAARFEPILTHYKIATTGKGTQLTALCPFHGEKSGSLKINQEDVTEQTLGPRLEEIFKTRAERVAFVRGEDNLEFKEVAKVIDIAKGAGVDKVGLMTAKMEAGQ